MIHNEAVRKIVILSRLLGGEGFEDWTEVIVNNLIDAHSDPLTHDDQLELTKSASEEEMAEEIKVEDEGLSLERLGVIMRTQQQLQSYIEEWDPFFERALKTINGLNSAMETYRVLYTTMEKQYQQGKVTWFFELKPKRSRLQGSVTPHVCYTVIFIFRLYCTASS